MLYAQFDQLKDIKQLDIFNTFFRPIKEHENNFRFWFLRNFYQLKDL
jgi:hypothetical protein